MDFLKDKVFFKSVLLLSIPIALQNLVTSVLNIFDQMMVGWLPPDIADNCLSAVYLANQVVFIFEILIFAACNTANIFIAQYTNNGMRDRIPCRVGFVLAVNLCVILAVGLLCGLAPGAVIGLFRPDESYAGLAEEFLRVVSLSLLPMGLSITFTYSMRAIKRMKVALISNIIAVLCNIGFNYWFMFGGGFVPAMGLIGAAWGTVVSRSVELLLVLGGIFLFKYPIVGRLREMFRFDAAFTKQYFKMFFPILCNEIFWVLSSSFVYPFVYAQLPNSSVVLSSVTIAQSVDKIVSVAMIGVGSAVGIVMSNVIGDGDRGKVDDYARKSHHFAVFVGVLIALLTVGSAFVAPSFFTNNSLEARNQARNLLLLYACTAVFRTVTFNQVIGVLRSGGDTTCCMLVETLAIWLISVPLVLVGGLVFSWNVYILYLLSMVSEVIKCAVFYLRMRSGKWIKFDLQPAAVGLPKEELR